MCNLSSTGRVVTEKNRLNILMAVSRSLVKMSKARFNLRSLFMLIVILGLNIK